MKTFDMQKFCKDLLNLRGRETQQSFAEKLQISRSTLSLLETGKQVPSLEILSKVCEWGEVQPNDYFCEYDNDALIYLMGTLEESDKEKINAMMNRIRIKEKYELLARRSANDINR